MNNSETETTSLKKLDRVAWYLDSAVPIPGTRLRLGVDPLIGLVPVVGDTIGALLSCYILNQASRMGAPLSVLVRMVFNILIDAMVGAIPLLGDLFDVAWRANRRNVELLRRYQDQPTRTVWQSRALATVLIVTVLAVVIAIGWLMVTLIGAIWQAITTM